MTDTVVRLHLTAPAEEWAKKLENLQRSDVRKSRRSEIVKKGFDIRTETGKMLARYKQIKDQHT